MSYLKAILEQRRQDIEAEQRSTPLHTLQCLAFERGVRRSFASSLRADPPNIIAEIKRASPSAGVFDLTSDAAVIAADYERGGAAAISVVTEPRSFLGSFRDLAAARASVSLPVLCKDFVVDEFQIWKAAAYGADAVLLIIAALEDRQLTSFMQLAAELQLDALCEVHGTDEAERAVRSGAHVIGINNRDLETFTVDTNVALRVRATLPVGITVVGESGYRTPDDVATAVARGMHAILVGEALLQRSDRVAALRELRGVPACFG